MTAISKQRIYRLSGNATVAITAVLFASPFILAALYLVELAARLG
jgi:hypothetical protein